MRETTALRLVSRESKFILLYISCSYLILLQEREVTTEFFVYICDSTARDVFLGVLCMATREYYRLGSGPGGWGWILGGAIVTSVGGILVYK